MKQDARSIYHYSPVTTEDSAKFLSTNATTWRHPTHRWYNFIAGYSPEFVYSCIMDASLKANDKVLDPFAGCGTTLVTAQMAGLDSVGYEPHPFFHKIAAAKVADSPSIAHLSKIHAAIVSGFEIDPSDDALSDSAWIFLNKLFDPHILKALVGARIGLERVDLDRDPLAFLILSRLIDECSFAQTDGIYKAPTSRKRAAIPKEAIKAIIETIAADATRTPYARLAESKIYNDTSENMNSLAPGSVGLIVTSPPYLNNFDYAEMTRMHLYFWNIAGSWGEITDKVRSKLITNTTTALKGKKEKQYSYSESIPTSVKNEMQDIFDQLCVLKKQKLGKKDYDLLLFPYMAQMQTVYSECYRVLRVGGKAHTVISDAAFYGVHVPSPQWLAEILRSIGFRKVDCSIIRTRGHRWKLDKRAGSPIGLGEYHIVAVK